jgi:plastocyanin
MRQGAYGLLLALLVLSLAAPPAGTAAGAPRIWTVLVGGGVKDTAVVANAFSPRTVEIAVGDTVKWDFQEPWTLHTVTFAGKKELPALERREGDKTYIDAQLFFPAAGKTYDGTSYRNSGVPAQGPSAPHFSYSLTFTKAGTYAYSCALHGPDMSGTVIVRERAVGAPAAVAERGRKDFRATLTAGQAAFAKWNPEREGSTLILPMLGDPKAGWTHLRFSREPLVIKSGTTVTWAVRDPFEIHTVTFTSGQQPPEFLVIEPQKQGPPKVLENPNTTAATPAKTYDGTGYVNSGVLYPPGVPGNPPTKFSLTFTKPGRYEYWCAIHAPWGMKGTIVVQ